MESVSMIYLSGCLFLSILLILIRLLNKLWWVPIQTQTLMNSQGIRGPSYKFLHGSTKEIINMRNETMANPMDLSHDIFPKIQPHVYSWTKLYGRNFIYWYGSQAKLVVTEPELIKEILNNKDSAYPKMDVKYYIRKLLGDGLVTSEGEKWCKIRKLANHAFHADSLKVMIPAMIASVEKMLEKWREYDGQEIEVYNEFKILTSEIISRTAFGSSYLEGENIFKMLSRIALLAFRNAYKVKLPLIGKLVKTSDEIESEKLEQGIRDTIVKMVKRREEKVMLGEAESYGNDFLGLLVKAHSDNDQSRRITIDDVVDECKTFYFAGHETTASALSWTIFLLSIHGDWQEKARKEVLHLFGHENPTPDNISKLKTMSMIVNESLRLYPPVVDVARKAGREVKLGKFVLPENMELSIPTQAVHHNPEIWGEDFHLFKPERFAEGMAKATNHNAVSFLSFGLGPRTCVGLNFATTEIKIALSMILQRYKFKLAPNYVHSPIQLITVRPQHGLQIMLRSL